MTETYLKAPFPWFGGKSTVAHLVWQRFGHVGHYIEPFAGSLAVLLGRPNTPHVETVNDLDCYLANFWRAISLDPESVAHWADWPVNEIDLHARHRWLVERTEFRERMRADPDYYDPKVAGWWVWGISQWIGSGWCSVLSNKLPSIGDPGKGIHALRSRNLPAYFAALTDRLRNVRVCCGEWNRVLGPSVLTAAGTCGVFLDPPYCSQDRDPELYAEESMTIAHDVRSWAIAHGSDKNLRIALCGYEGEHEMPADWVEIPWKAFGGYGSQANKQGRENAGKERIWFSPYCKNNKTLFDYI